jgi:beta-galactosidase
MLDSQIAEWGGEMLYINKSARIPFWQTEYSRDEGLRKYWDEFSPPFHRDGDGPPYRNALAREYNRNQDSHAIENVVRWYDYWRERPGTGTRVNSGGVNIIFSDSNTHYRGAENYRRSGEVDPMRMPKEGFWVHQVMWDGWVDVERPRAHIIGHWNYPARTKKDVYVVSSADRVELFLNGKSHGHGRQSSRFLYTFENVEWQPGELKAIGSDDKGAKLCEAVQHTSGEATAIRLKTMTAPAGMKADGADAALIEVEVVDAQGLRCPTNLNLIEFGLTGPVEWRGGIAQGPGNYILAKTLPVECGVNRVLVRSTTQAGRIVLTAKSEGLKPATVELVSRAIQLSDGHDVAQPGEDLPFRLNRGPTPLGPSFKMTRVAVPIARASAGANAGTAGQSFDDVETTSWSNDNRVASGWITYEFARSATVHEATLKFSGWRTRSYPIRITVDNQEVFRGDTPRSLGYVTLPLKPVKGSTLTIALAGASTIRDAFNITELQNQQNVATGDAEQGRGTLSIVEAEFYEPGP